VTDILITGGSDGIGLAVAKLLAANGDTRVTLVARSESKLREAVAQLPGTGHDSIVADLSQVEGTDLIARRLAGRRYDVLINNAGAGLYGEFSELPLDDQLRMMRLNMETVTVLSHTYLRQAKPGDTLVNTASFLAYAPLPRNATYSATKAFVATLSEALWWESKKKGVYVLGFSPGVIAGGCAPETSLAEPHHRLRHAPAGSAAASRQPEKGDQHDGEEKPDVIQALLPMIDHVQGRITHGTGWCG
jgi:uncharacterized protein